jgi:hypothetical protein
MPAATSSGEWSRVADHKAPWNFDINSNFPRDPQKRAVGVRKSRAFASPFAPISPNSGSRNISP